jgi:dihydroflavonol-4-reductase
MRVLVTGGTGYVGSHAVKALLDRGHEVRLLVRSKERIGPALEPLGVEPIDDVVVGDVTDEAAVGAALEGCDAVVHGASVYTLDVRRSGEIEKTNVAGTRLVLESAHKAGLDPIVHVSSVVALLPTRAPRLSATSPVGTGVGVYSRSKALSEFVAREMQAAGAPVVTILPGSVWGSHDPHLGESHQIATDFLRGQMPMLPSTGGVPVVDVRDVAEAIAAAMEPGKGPRSYLLAARPVTVGELAQTMRATTGRKVRYVGMPMRMFLMMGPMFTGLQRISPWRMPISREGMRVLATGHREVDNENVRSELGVEFRPLDESIRDTVSALVAMGKISPKQAGMPAEQVTQPA